MVSLSHKGKVCLIKLRFEILLTSSDNVNDYVVHVYRKYMDLDPNNKTCRPGSEKSQLTHKFICRLLNKLQFLRHCTLQKFGKNFLMTFISFLNVRTLKRTHSYLQTYNPYQSIKFTMEEGSTGELMFHDTLLKQNNGKRSLGILAVGNRAT